MDTHYVYIVGHSKGDMIAGPVKVGISRQPIGRLASLQTGNPAKLQIVCMFAVPNREIACAVELAFHQVMNSDRMEGEWFDLSPMNAAELMCSNIKIMLKNWLEIDGPDLEDALKYSGVLAVEQKIAREGTQ